MKELAFLPTGWLEGARLYSICLIKMHLNPLNTTSIRINISVGRNNYWQKISSSPVDNYSPDWYNEWNEDVQIADHYLTELESASSITFSDYLVKALINDYKWSLSSLTSCFAFQGF